MQSQGEMKTSIAFFKDSNIIEFIYLLNKEANLRLVLIFRKSRVFDSTKSRIKLCHMPMCLVLRCRMRFFSNENGTGIITK